MPPPRIATAIGLGDVLSSTDKHGGLQGAVRRRKTRRLRSFEALDPFRNAILERLDHFLASDQSLIVRQTIHTPYLRYNTAACFTSLSDITRRIASGLHRRVGHWVGCDLQKNEDGSVTTNTQATSNHAD